MDSLKAWLLFLRYFFHQRKTELYLLLVSHVLHIVLLRISREGVSLIYAALPVMFLSFYSLYNAIEEKGRAVFVVLLSGRHFTMMMLCSFGLLQIINFAALLTTLVVFNYVHLISVFATIHIVAFAGIVLAVISNRKKIFHVSAE